MLIRPQSPRTESVAQIEIDEQYVAARFKRWIRTQRKAPKPRLPKFHAALMDQIRGES